MNKYDNFEAYEKEYYGLWFGKNKNLIAALELCVEAYGLYKEHEAQILMDLMMLNFDLEHLDETKVYLTKALDKGYWYPEHFIGKILNHTEFKRELIRWETLRDQSEKVVKYEVILPIDYNTTLSYPLMVSLHGWGEGLDLFKQFWSSELIEKDYIHVMVQSSQRIGFAHYIWQDFNQAKSDVYEVIDYVNQQYKLNDLKLISGFSQGGATAISLAQDKPDFFAGVIALNPNKPTTFDASKLKDYNVAVSIITGDLDQSLIDQKEMINEYKAVELKVKLRIKENMGHWFPEDLSNRLDESIVFVTDGR